MENCVTDTPEISIVVPVRRAETTVGATISSLLEQCRQLPVEVIAVVSEDDPSRAALERQKSLGLSIVVAPSRQGIPQLRRDGVWHARAPWVVITEDHCLFPEGWVRNFLESTRRPEQRVRGGPVLNGVPSLVGWVVYFSRYSAFLPPVEEGPVKTLPGTGACYPRELLLEHTDLLREGFWEAELNEALARRNVSFWMSPALAVRQHQQRGLLEFIAVRFRHGRCFGARCATHTRSRILPQLRAPLVPFVLLMRAARAVFRKGRNRVQFLCAFPLLFLCFCSWAGGESLGYLLGGNSLETD
jgi:glycosyltransferase involved in cell wall biosynthesis